MCWSYFLTKLQGWRPMIILKRDSNTGALCIQYCEIFKSTYLEEYLQIAASVFLKYRVSADLLFIIKYIM